MTIRRLALVIMAVGQVVSAVLVQRYGGQFTTENRSGEPPIVPAGYTFSIWLVIEVLSLAYAIWALHSRAPGQATRDRLTIPLLVVFTGFSAWLAVSEIQPRWTTVAVFAVMLAALLWAVRLALAARDEIRTWPRAAGILLWALLGLYTGWSTIAIWVNLATSVADSGAPLQGTAGLLGQLAILAGAAATAGVLVAWMARVTVLAATYAAATVWAFVGVAFGTYEASQPVLTTVALAGLAATLAVLFAATVRARTQAAQSSDGAFGR